MLRRRKDKAFFYPSLAEKLSEVQSVLGINVAMKSKTKLRNFKEQLKISGKDGYTPFIFMTVNITVLFRSFQYTEILEV